ncbi:MAG: hypothetical protein RR415_08645 [Ruthenibacterium sp.]
MGQIIIGARKGCLYLIAQNFDGNDSYVYVDKATGKGISVLSQSARTWMLVVNNPADYNVTPQTVAQTLNEACESGAVTFWCCINEKSVELNPDTGKQTPHMHIVLYCPGKQRGGWLHKRFPNAALFPCASAVPSLIMYIKKDKDGAWYKKHPEKLAEKLPAKEAQFTEWGDMPQGKKNGLLANSEKVVDAIASGLSDYELLQLDPDMWKKLPQIKQTRMVIKSEEFLHKFRNMDVTYIEGATGTGKTRFVMQAENYDVFTVDDYDHVWDGYEQQEAVFFDEFRSQPDFSDMLRWLDGNPVKLKARYSNAVACFTKIYIASNWSLEQQYLNVQREHPTDWQAFLRRIHHRRIYTGYNTYTEYDNVNGTWLKKGA